MGRRQSRSAGGGEEGGGHGVGLWYVSFSDMITLLLSFFVMLCTFSSYDEDSKNKFAGAVYYMYNYSVFPGKSGVRDSFLTPIEGQFDRTEGGSEMPTSSEELGSIRNPLMLPCVAEPDAHRDRKALYLSSTRMFWGKGSVLTDEGKRNLRLIAEFLHKLPCQVIIGEIGAEESAGSASTDGRLERAWAIVEFLTVEGRLPLDRFNISGTVRAPTGAAKRVTGQRVMEIALLSRSIYR
jgi:hypothetical protein